MWRASRRSAARSGLTMADVYEGEFKAGMRDGGGTVRWADGAVDEESARRIRERGAARFVMPTATFTRESSRAVSMRGAARLVMPTAPCTRDSGRRISQRGVARFVMPTATCTGAKFKAGMRDGCATFRVADGTVWVDFWKADKARRRGRVVEAPTASRRLEICAMAKTWTRSRSRRRGASRRSAACRCPRLASTRASATQKVRGTAAAPAALPMAACTKVSTRRVCKEGRGAHRLANGDVLRRVQGGSERGRRIVCQRRLEVGFLKAGRRGRRRAVDGRRPVGVSGAPWQRRGRDLARGGAARRGGRPTAARDWRVRGRAQRRRSRAAAAPAACRWRRVRRCTRMVCRRGAARS